jgi:hypothetical protein
LTSKAALTKYRCAICGTRLREGQYVYSRFTKKRYCLDVKRHTKKKRGPRDGGPSLRS